MTRRGGFTLVELVVVVLILGILAAIAAPKIINNSDKASDSSIAATLAAVRDAIELYRGENNGKLPIGSKPTPAQFKAALDPYLRGTNFPYVKVGGLNSNDVSILDTGPSVGGAQGWAYNWNTGEIIINSNATLMTDSTTAYKDL